MIILQKKMIARHFDKVDFSNTCYAWKSTPLQYDCNCTANSKIGSESSLSEIAPTYDLTK